VAAATLAVVLLATGCAAGAHGSLSAPRDLSATPGASVTGPPYDVRPLLHPARDYLGVSLPGVPASTGPLDRWTSTTGAHAGLVKFYLGFGDEFDTEGARRVWKAGAIPLVTWEPYKMRSADIAAGGKDDYIKRFATRIRELNVPIALSFGHEMNGFWYPWGTHGDPPASFVAAWRHLHNVFLDAGATNVIWVWEPNIINPVRKVRLRPFWPGDAYVDWVGIVGYFARTGPHTFAGVFGPTLKQVRIFTHRPVLLSETGAQTSPYKPAEIKNILVNIAARHDIIGLVWFNYKKETDWRVESDPASLQAFRTYVTDPRLGVDPRKP
jgi:hypothetical protein